MCLGWPASLYPAVAVLWWPAWPTWRRRTWPAPPHVPHSAQYLNSAQFIGLFDLWALDPLSRLHLWRDQAAPARGSTQLLGLLHIHHSLPAVSSSGLLILLPCTSEMYRRTSKCLYRSCAPLVCFLGTLNFDKRKEKFNIIRRNSIIELIREKVWSDLDVCTLTGQKKKTKKNL